MKSTSCLHNRNRGLESPRKPGLRISDPVPQNSGKNVKGKKSWLPVQVSRDRQLRTSEGKLICPAW